MPDFADKIEKEQFDRPRSDYLEDPVNRREYQERRHDEQTARLVDWFLNKRGPKPTVDMKGDEQ